MSYFNIWNRRTGLFLVTGKYRGNFVLESALGFCPCFPCRRYGYVKYWALIRRNNTLPSCVLFMPPSPCSSRLECIFFTRRVHSETAARFALVLGCFWHELVIIAPHPVAEASSSAFVFAALAVIMAAKMTTQRVAICGFLLGMAFVLRVQYAPTIGLIGLALLFYADNRGRITLIVAGLLAILIAGLVDYFYWGGFLQTYINYAKVQFPAILNTLTMLRGIFTCTIYLSVAPAYIMSSPAPLYFIIVVFGFLSS